MLSSTLSFPGSVAGTDFKTSSDAAMAAVAAPIRNLRNGQPYLGNPIPRMAMMLRWISLVPPPTICMMV